MQNRMAGFIKVITRVALFYFLQSEAWAATIEGVKLVGDSNNYINLNAKDIKYKLRCSFRAGYDDPITSVNWYKDGRLAYTWNEGADFSTAFLDLQGHVTVSGTSQLEHLNFGSGASLDLSGNYTCEVVSKVGSVKSTPYHLVVLDVPSDVYVSNVTLLSNHPKSMEKGESEDGNGNCTLLWDFLTPAIFPRPNVTCGYYSYLHDDVTNSVPAGLTMHMLNNGSWQAGFEHIRVHVSEIPREKRLGCAVSVPDTSFKKVVKFEDNFAIDHLIDSQGCPSMFLDPQYGLKFTLVGGERNCRGDLVPSSSDTPLTVKFRCNPNEFAMFPNGTVLSSWSREMTCDPMDLVWRGVEDGRMGHGITDPEKDVPMCVPNVSAGNQITLSRIALIFVVALSWHYQFLQL